MNQASLYQRVNSMQRQDARQIIEEYANTIQWRADGRDTLLDVGSGSGNVLMDHLYPLMPAQFVELTGTDISEKMVTFASKFYSSYERTKFRVLDIGTTTIPIELCEQYDHVTSFYCLHWVPNHEQALRNIYKMLRRDGGDCLLVFLGSHPVFDVYKALFELPKWQQCMKDVEQFIPTLHYSTDPSTDFGKLMHSAGFENYNVEIRNENFVYESVEKVKENVRSVCPFLDRIPDRQHEEFLDDFVNIVVAMKMREQHENGEAAKYVTSYKLVVAYARKCASFLSNVINDERMAKGLN